MLAWVGVGWSFVGAILFSGAAICLRGEREREEAINMQYLMPGNLWGVSFFFSPKKKIENNNLKRIYS